MPRMVFTRETLYFRVNHSTVKNFGKLLFGKGGNIIFMASLRERV